MIVGIFNFEMYSIKAKLKTMLTIKNRKEYIRNRTSAKLRWSAVSRFVDNSFKVLNRIIKIRWEARTSAD